MEKSRLPMNSIKKISLIIAFALVALTPMWFAVAALGTKYGLWHFFFGLVKMTFTFGPKILIVVTAVCFITLIIQLASAPRRGAVLALIPFVVSGIMLFYFVTTVKSGLGLPPIHDIQTDWTNPVIAPDELIVHRKEKGFNPILENPVVPESAKGNWPLAVGKSNAKLQAEFYPFITPYLSAMKPEKLFNIILVLAKEQGWKIEKSDKTSDGGLIHATYTSFWYGFTDDILIRVIPYEKDKSRVDIRSISRVGLSDLGANASRIKRYLDEIKNTSNF